MEQQEIKIKHIETKSVMTKSNVPLGGYSVNPYVGCPHACKYCYASFMKRFTGHNEEWGTFMDVKEWPQIRKPEKYAGQKVVIGTVTDGYNPLEETYKNTYDKINIVTDAADIEIKKSENEDIYLKIYSEKDRSKVLDNETELNIEVTQKKCVGLCINNKIAIN